MAPNGNEHTFSQEAVIATLVASVGRIEDDISATRLKIDHIDALLRGDNGKGYFEIARDNSERIARLERFQQAIKMNATKLLIAVVTSLILGGIGGHFFGQ